VLRKEKIGVGLTDRAMSLTLRNAERRKEGKKSLLASKSKGVGLFVRLLTAFPQTRGRVGR